MACVLHMFYIILFNLTTKDSDTNPAPHSKYHNGQYCVLTFDNIRIFVGR